MPSDQPHRKRTTLKDVASHAGVSMMLASYTFSRPERVSEASRAKVLAAAQEIGYRPNQAARSLRTGTTGLLGVVVSEHLGYAFRDPGARQFLAGVADVCAQHGHGMVLLPTGGHLDALAAIASVDVDGYVFWTTAPDDPALASALGTGRPVAIQGGPDVAGTTCFSIDDRAAALAVATEGLKGSSHPAVISFPVNGQRQAHQGRLSEAHADLPVTRARLDGITDALQAKGIPAHDVPLVVLAENDHEAARQAVTDLLAEFPQTDALLCLSDEIALAALEATQSSGRLAPDEVAITGFDGQPEALALGLTTITQDLHHQGQNAALTALGRATGAPSPQTWTLHLGTTTRRRQP